MLYIFFNWPLLLFHPSTFILTILTVVIFFLFSLDKFKNILVSVPRFYAGSGSGFILDPDPYSGIKRKPVRMPNTKFEKGTVTVWYLSSCFSSNTSINLDSTVYSHAFYKLLVWFGLARDQWAGIHTYMFHWSSSSKEHSYLLFIPDKNRINTMYHVYTVQVFITIFILMS